MDYDIVDEAYRVTLIGKSGRVADQTYAETGMRLMEEMYDQIRHIGLAGFGHQHWVYLAEDRMFTGVGWSDMDTDTGFLEKMEFALLRHIRYRHRGPYNQLPAVWQELVAAIERDGHSWGYPNVEYYGDWQEDPAKLETTIMIGLRTA